MKILLSAVIAYVLGSLSFSIVLSKFLFRKDVREGGSGNAGATNMARSFGKLAGALTLVGDMLKTALAVIIGKHLAGDITAVLTKKISLASILASFSAIPAAWFVASDKRYFWMALIAACIIIFRHHENISRLIRGEEKDFHFAHNSKKGKE